MKIGDKVLGYTVTQVSRTKIFGVEGDLPQNYIDDLIRHFARPAKERGYIFRPGCRIDHLL